MVWLKPLLAGMLILKLDVFFDFCKAKITVFLEATAFAKAEAEYQTAHLACVMCSLFFFNICQIMYFNKTFILVYK